MNGFPENFSRLHQGEEFVRDRSVEFVQESPDLTLHLLATEKSVDAIHHYIHRDEHRDDDDLTVRLLGMRMFNCISATLKLILSGYYQASTLQHRDLVETFFLLDYFLSERPLIARWRMADEKTLRNEFAPIHVRKALDARDAFTGEKRAALYKLLSGIAGHPHPRGFQLIQLPDGNHHCGPFFDETPLKATISELGRSALQAYGIFGQFFEPKSKSDYQIKLAFLEAQGRWFKHFYGKEPIGTAELDGMRAMIARLPA